MYFIDDYTDMGNLFSNFKFYFYILHLSCFRLFPILISKLVVHNVCRVHGSPLVLNMSPSSKCIFKQAIHSFETCAIIQQFILVLPFPNLRELSLLILFISLLLFSHFIYFLFFSNIQSNM